MTRIPPAELLRCKDVFDAGHDTYASLMHGLVQRLMPSWEAVMEAIGADILGDRLPSDMVRTWAGWVDGACEERHLKYQLLS